MIKIRFGGRWRNKRTRYLHLFIIALVIIFVLDYYINDDYVSSVIMQGLILFTTILIIVCFLAIVFKFVKKHFKNKKYMRSDLRKIDKMTGREFEEYLVVQFKKLGYKVILTAESGDYGADLVIERNGKRTIIQAKRYDGNVGNSAVQEVVAALGYYDADDGIVVSNSYFTANAKILANANGVELWDRDKIIKVFKI